MAEVHQPPTGGKGGDLPSRVELLPLDFADREAVRGWLARVRAQIEDVLAAGEDAARPPDQRTLGRAMARAALAEGRRALGQLLAAADRGAGPGG